MPYLILPYLQMPRPRTSIAHRTRAACTVRPLHTPVALAALCCCLWGGQIFAQSTAQEVTPNPADAATPDAHNLPSKLKSSPMLQELLSDDMRRLAPTFIFGDRMSGRTDLETTIEGNAVLRRAGTVLRADRLDYYQPEDLLKARGNVQMNRLGNVYAGPEAQIKIDAMEGFIVAPTYKFARSQGHGEAERIDFVDEQRSVARNVRYTTCERKPGPSWLPDWVLQASQVKFDTESQVGEASGVVLRFKDVPILAAPFITFPLSDARKSGWLPATFNIDNTSGVEVAMPYYWNIAPNRDATITPSLLTKRGLNVSSEFRYLESNYNGTARVDYMPNDRLTGGARWGVASSHTGGRGTDWGSLTGRVSVNRVGDNDYWSDFPRSISSLTQRQLPSEIGASWGLGAWSADAKLLRYQTLQSVSSPIVPAYDRLPQLTARYTKPNVRGFDLGLELDTTRFVSNAALTGQPNARRSYALATVSRPWVAPGWFFTPKLQLHTGAYQFDSGLTAASALGATALGRTVPTASFDSGLIFERNASYFGRSFLQTLEPRAFYVYTPFRDQSAIPVYDTGAKDFNFASIYTENAFAGNDRISDNNLLTVGVTSRFLDPASGAEVLRLGYAQRLRFKDQNVTLPAGLPYTDRLSDMLFGATVNWSPHWASDSTVQYNPKLRESERATMSARYTPSNYRVLSATYRLQRDVSKQLDLGWQWPLNDLWGGKDTSNAPSSPGQGLGEGRWYGVGRLNFNLIDRKIVDLVAGFEYDAGCWLGRVVVERLQTTAATANKKISFQLELSGFSRLSLGNNPLRSLQQNVPRYQLLREKTTAPSRFSNYE
jgi:LPS-assembly protein